MIPIGHGADGPVWRSLLETSHVLVGGESRSGKSTWLNAMLVALLTAHAPASLRLALIDPKGVEFTAYDGLPHLVRPVAVTPPTATAVTGWLTAEMDRRRTLFAGVLARKLETYNERARRTDDPTLPLILVAIDEVTDIALQCGLRSAFYKNLIRLASKGAAFGLILVLATQNPKAEVLSTLIRGNLSTRIAFRVSSVEHARTILGRGGAQDLPRTIRGRMLARLDEGTTPLQGYHVSDETILSLARRWAGQSAPALSALERELVGYSLRTLDGAFPIGRLYDAFRGRISRRQLLKLGRRWEGAGYLTAPASPTAPRYVSDSLRALAEREEDLPPQTWQMP
jgi:S-DNA-T family DNA segregation ATPase FtsK/SpoIIIE